METVVVIIATILPSLLRPRLKSYLQQKKLEKKYNPITQFDRIQIREYYLKQVLLRFICGL